MIISIGADHAGFPMKDAVIAIIKDLGHEVIDNGTFSTAPVDFPDIARKVCGQVISGKAERGMMVCGTGIGASIACNKYPGIRAALVHDYHSAHQCVEHDNANVMCVGAWIIGIKTIEEFVRAFLNAEFSTEEQFRRRVEKLRELERWAAEETLRQD
ncbi:MAG: ribose 5-phosphate isomerase B [Anaerolineaceae bacterium]|nr:ribose 5-phosphate isomerase B [Anaerolineaceae bacterium]